MIKCFFLHMLALCLYKSTLAEHSFVLPCHFVFRLFGCFGIIKFSGCLNPLFCLLDLQNGHIIESVSEMAYFSCIYFRAALHLVAVLTTTLHLVWEPCHQALPYSLSHCLPHSSIAWFQHIFRIHDLCFSFLE